jgi:hypothetical protein
MNDDANSRKKGNTQRGLQDLCKLAISVWNMRVLLRQGKYNISKSSQRFVDVLCLFEPVSCNCRTVHPFTSSKVHKMQSPTQSVSSFQILTLDMNGHNTAGKKIPTSKNKTRPSGKDRPHGITLIEEDSTIFGPRKGRESPSSRGPRVTRKPRAA